LPRRPLAETRPFAARLQDYSLPIYATLFLLAAIGWGALVYHQFGTFNSADTASEAGLTIATKGDAKPVYAGTSSRAITGPVGGRSAAVSRLATGSIGGESAASIVAREWSRFESLKIADRAAAVQRVAKDAQPIPPVRLAALETVRPQLPTSRAATEAVPSRIPSHVGAEMALVDFVTAPFPYHGAMPGSGRPFLNANAQGRRGHVNFRGHVYWEADTFSDDRVLLHIPPGFDPTRPAVMVVFFHGHGADLARDVRDRQKLPEQITASGMNAVLVAPQFAVDAADSSAGKFWEPNGFKRFLDEAAVKLAKLSGDSRRAAVFAKMPIVIVAYSGGFGPTLSVLDRGGVGGRVRGIVLLDALYAGMETFANWIANNRSAFFISSYTPHTAYRNAELERLLSERGVPYATRLRSGHLQGMVAFLPAGNVSHRDFVTHAWADNPVKDVLARMDNTEPAVVTASSLGSFFSFPWTTGR
jgi:hypothetical protein